MEAAAAAAKRKEIMEAAAAAARRKEMQEAAAAARRKEMQEAAVAAAVKRKTFLELSGSKTYCVRLCSHVGCVTSVHARGVCRDHGPGCSPEGCERNVQARGVCKGHDHESAP
jgi:hypothetical protein